MDPVAALIAGGLVGYAIRGDGKLEPINYAQLAEAMRSNKPSFYKKIEIDTSVARDDEEFAFEGSLIYVDNPTTPTGSVFIRLNEKDNDQLELTRLRKLRSPFYRFFITNASGAGTLTLFIMRGFQVEPFEGVVDTVMSMNLNDLANVAALAPSDEDIILFNLTTSYWESGVLTDIALFASHKARHQDGGDDEISVVGLAGLLAEDQHVLDVEVVSAVEAAASLDLVGSKVVFNSWGAVFGDAYYLFMRTDYTAYIASIDSGYLDLCGQSGIRFRDPDQGVVLAWDAASNVLSTAYTIRITGTLDMGQGTGTMILPVYSDPVTQPAEGTFWYNTTKDKPEFATASGMETVATAAAFDAHKTRHQDGGADEISIAGLAGESAELATHKAVKATNATLGHVIVETGSAIDVDGSGKLTLGDHAATHQDGGTDEITVASLAGVLTEDQHVIDAEVVSAIEAASPLTLPAFTLGGTVAGGAQEINNLGIVYIGDTANAKQVIGLTINTGANDPTEAIALKASNVAHGATVLAETDTYGYITRGEGAGGIFIRGLKGSAEGNYGGVTIQGWLAENVDTTKSTAGRALIELVAGQLSGTGTANVVADGNVLAVRAKVGGSLATALIVDEDGDLWLNGGIDFHDDMIMGADKDFYPTTTNQGEIGKSGNIFAAVRATAVYGGDFVFDNGWRLTETERGVALIRPNKSIAKEWN